MLVGGKVAVVSGVGPGLGRAIALALATDGADVVLVARTRERLEAVAAEVDALGRRAICVAADITDPDACVAVAEEAVAAFGRVDVLVNSAFVQPPFETVEDASMETFRQAFDVNLFGHVQLTKAVLPSMKATGGGSIVFVNTMSTRRIKKYFGVYVASKMALLGLAQVLAVELGEYRIRVNSVHPGYIWADSVKWYFERQAEQRGVGFDVVYDEAAGETALHHLPGPDEIAQTVVFLASDRMASSITGQSVDVNAGQWIR